MKSRAADYTIQGFLYQFNKTILEILSSPPDTEIVVEGIIEDIDIHGPYHTKAIQCKYHEAKSRFSLSDFYKPILQMMQHCLLNPSMEIEYRLFAFIQGQTEGDSIQITTDQVNQIFTTTNKNLSSYVNDLRGKLDVEKFIDKFSIEFGPSFSDLMQRVESALEKCDFQKADIPWIIYPNALHHIASLSVKHDPSSRRLSKADLVQLLHEIKTTTVSRWTLALATAREILTQRRKQLKQNLSKNVRRRHFLISETAATDFKAGIVVFIADYLSKYHFKPSHTEPPLFCLDCDAETFDDIRQRIHEKEIRFNDGFIGARFHTRHFLRKPVVSPKKDQPQTEFEIRLLREGTDMSVLNTPKCDDFFILSAKEYPQLDLTDVNIERLETLDLQQAKFLLGVNDAIE